MSTGNQILGTHALDLLSVTSNNEIYTVGTYSLQGGAYGRYYQANNINNGFFFGLSNNSAAIWRPDGAKTQLVIDGGLVTSNITTTNTCNNIYFGGSTLYGVCNIVLGGSIYDYTGNPIKLGGGGVTDQELITTATCNLSATKASILNPPATFGSNQYYLSAYTGRDSTPFVQKLIYTYGSNYSFAVTDISLAGASNSVTYFQGASGTQEIRYIWTSNSWTALGASPATVILPTRTGLYNTANYIPRTIITNDTTPENRVLFSFNLYNNYYILSGTFKVTAVDNSVVLDATNWPNIGLYNATPTGHVAATVLKSQVVIADTAPQVVSFTFYVDATASAGTGATGYPYVIAFSGVGQALTISGTPTETYLEIVPVTTARGMGVDDKVTVRQSIQLNPVRQVFTVAANGTYTFNVSTVGNFTAAAVNTDVYINGTKYVYSSTVLKDYDILVNYSAPSNTTTFTIILTYPASSGDVVEISVWPSATTSNYYYSGYFYQTALATSTPWLNVAGGGIRYTGSRTIIDGDLIIQGGIYAGSNTSAFYSGSQFSVDSLSVTSNVIGTLNIIDRSVTPSKLYLMGGNVGVGTTSAQKLLHVAGDLRVDGVFYNSSNQPIWAPVNALTWTQSTQTPPTFVTPSIANFAYSASNGIYRWMGSELVYNIQLAGTLLTTQTQDFTIQVPTPVNVANYLANTIVGNLFLAVYTGATSNTFPAFARVNTANANLLTIRAVSGITDVSLSGIAAGSAIALNGTITYATTTVAAPQVSAMTYVPPKFSQDPYGNVLLNGTSNTAAMPRGLLEVYQNSNTAALVIDQIGSGDLIQVRKNGATNVVVNNTGSVGIGTTAPIVPLHVEGNAYFNGNISAGNLGMFRNRIINGDMRIAQRGTTTTSGTGSLNNYGCVDRFVTGYNITTGGIRQDQITLTSSDNPYQYGFKNSYRVTASTANSNYSWIIPGQIIEGYNVSDFNWGSSYGSPVVVSFWMRTNVATNSIIALTIRNYNSGNVWWSYNASITVTSSGNWQYVTVNIPAPPNGSTWNLNSTNACIEVYIGGFQGTISSSPNTWQAGNYVGLTTGVNIWATLNNYIEFTGVQFEKGTIVTPFEFRPYGVELQLCQRYYVRYGGASVYNIIGTGVCISTTAAWIYVAYPQPMRTTPVLGATSAGSLIINNLGANYALSAIGLNANDSSGLYSARVDATIATASLTAGQATLLRINNSLTSYLDLSAEL